MINAEKVELMAKTALYERGARSEDIKRKTYFDAGTGALRLKSIITGAAIYVLLAALVILVAGNEIFDFKDRTAAGIIILAAMIIGGAIFTILYSIIVMKYDRTEYSDTRSSLVRYDLLKRRLKQTMQEEKAETGAGE